MPFEVIPAKYNRLASRSTRQPAAVVIYTDGRFVFNSAATEMFPDGTFRVLVLRDAESGRFGMLRAESDDSRAFELVQGRNKMWITALSVVKEFGLLTQKAPLALEDEMIVTVGPLQTEKYQLK